MEFMVLPKRESIGHFVSHGCVRMQIEQAEELFEWIEQDDPVIIEYQRVQISIQNRQDIALTIHPDPYQQQSLSLAEIEQMVLRQLGRYDVYLNLTAIERALSEPVENSIIRLIGYIE